jgi:hypothetical protein
MKLKTIKREFKEIETDIELPVFLYFQDELCNDELIMITDEYQLKVKYSYRSLVIEKSESLAIEEHYVQNNLTTKEHFMEIYNEALKSVSDALS